jgi:hypothetical protein
VTPAIGLVWHAVRREWRSLIVSAVLTGAVVGVGFILAPDLWNAWIDTLLHADQTYEIGHPLGPVPVRLAVAGVITAAGAWLGRAWLIPVAMFVAVPGLWAFNWGLLAAIPRLLRDR